MLEKMSNASIVPFVPRRKADGSGYELIVLEPEPAPPIGSAEETAAWMNKVVEKCILMAPDQYMWLHRRFQDAPAGRAVTLLILLPATRDVAGSLHPPALFSPFILANRNLRLFFPETTMSVQGESYDYVRHA